MNDEEWERQRQRSIMAAFQTGRPTFADSDGVLKFADGSEEPVGDDIGWSGAGVPPATVKATSWWTRLKQKFSRKPNMTRNEIVQVELRSGFMTLGSVKRVDEKYATVIPAGAGGAPMSLAPNQLAWTFELENGKHVTWGQGRHDIDEYPRLTPESLARLKAK